MRTRWCVAIGLVASAALLLTGCSQQRPDTAGAGPSTQSLKIIFVTHGQAGDPYWSVVKNGLDQAGKDLGVSVSYQSPQTFDISEMKKQFDAAIAQKPAGIAFSLPDADALGPEIIKANGAGIPLVGLDSGEDYIGKHPELTKLLTHVGASQFEAAKLVGQRWSGEGVKTVACLNHEQGNSSLDVRCEGLKAGLTGGTVDNVAVNGKDPTDSTQRISAVLQKGHYDAALALGPVSVQPMIDGAKAAGFTGKLATFDLSPEGLQAVLDGHMEFAVDFQQYLMGYLPVLYITQYVKYGLAPTQPITPTGPSFVTKDTAAQILQLTKDGFR